MAETALATYLKNHLSGSAAELELAKRAASSFAGSPEYNFFVGYVRQIEEDRDVMRKILRETGHPDEGLAKVGRWAMERVVLSRMGDFTGRKSGISRLVEVEGALIGSFGRQKLWGALEKGLSTKLHGVDLAQLRSRAQEQSTHLERLLVSLAGTAFSE